MRKTMSVPRLLVHTESSVIANQSGPPLIPLASGFCIARPGIR